MPSRTRIKSASSRQASVENNPAAPGAIARIAIGENGNIAYASPAFCSLTHKSLAALMDTPAGKLISFSELPHKPSNITDIHTGHHRIFINGNP